MNLKSFARLGVLAGRGRLDDEEKSEGGEAHVCLQFVIGLDRWKEFLFASVGAGCSNCEPILRAKLRKSCV